MYHTYIVQYLYIECTHIQMLTVALIIDSGDVHLYIFSIHKQEIWLMLSYMCSVISIHVYMGMYSTCDSSGLT